MQKAATVFPRLILFLLLSITRSSSVDDPVGEKLRVDPQMFLPVKVGQDRIRDASVSHLDGLSILDKG